MRLTAFALDNLSYALRALQNGLVQRYVLGMLIGLFLLIAAGRFVLWLILGGPASHMDLSREHLLSVITFTPLVGALVLMLRIAGGAAEKAVALGGERIRAARLPRQPAALAWFDRGCRPTSSSSSERPGSRRSASSTCSASTGSRRS